MACPAASVMNLGVRLSEPLEVFAWLAAAGVAAAVVQFFAVYLPPAPILTENSAEIAATAYEHAADSAVVVETLAAAVAGAHRVLNRKRNHFAAGLVTLAASGAVAAVVVVIASLIGSAP
ncbi:hypothetical protein AB0I28_23535 [Phytomonospora sp. NPDC050363]|uniref:hypothetical protein n=1 Tax=Phytomonospora sp. NPDC050363 TaxID=3155642 RepID=UPI0033F7C8A2